MKKKFKYGIILPLKEVFLKKNSGAVSIFVHQYLKYSKLKNNTIIFTSKFKGKYLEKNVCSINTNFKFFTNLNYIKSVIKKKEFSHLSHLEIHNRPYYAEYLIKANINKKITLILHNNFFPNDSYINNETKLLLLDKCDSIVFVSKFLKNEFFKNLNIKDRNNVHVIYNVISKKNTFNKRKKKLIIFSGKLNKSKGYHIFGRAIIKILNEHTDWKALVIGNEKREQYFFSHKNLVIKDWVSHDKIIKYYDIASISVVNPTWNEPFGRTALESSSRGCAVITSKSGGINETFKNNLILKHNNVSTLYKKIKYLIQNNSILKKIQKINFHNQLINSKAEISKLDELKILHKDNFIKIKKNFNILHIGVFGDKQSHRIYNISLANKISNGFIRNGHHVINYDYRSKSSGFLNSSNIDSEIISIANNYRPDLVLLGHNNILDRKTLIYLNKKIKSKIALWYEDHITKNDPNASDNLKLIEKNNDQINDYFITTYPSYIKSKIPKSKLHFLPMPVDSSVEKYDLYKYKPKTKDLFFGVSHGVNRGILKKNHTDSRIKFINNLIKENNNLKFNFLGFNNHQPKWNTDLYDEMKKCYTTLNLSRGGPYKYTSSNRIATYMGNGMPTFVDKRLKLSDFFTNKEIIFYNSENDLLKKLTELKKNPNKIINIGKKGKMKYFKIFNNIIISNFILNKTLNHITKSKFIWDK